VQRDQQSALARAATLGKQTLYDQGRSQAQQLRQAVDESKGNVTQQLYQSADPAFARQQASEQASTFGQPSLFAPIANMFSSFTNDYLTNQLITAYRQGTSRYQNTDLSGAIPRAPK
jgi:hypothetical protein